MKNLVVIENATLDSLASRPGIGDQVPCLKNFRDAKAELKSCRSCGKTKTRNTNEFYARIKDCLANTTASGLRPVFEILDARQLRFVVRRGKSNVSITIRRPS